MARRPLLTMRSASGTGNWEKVWEQKMQAVVQHFNFFGGVYAEQACRDVLRKAEDNIVAGKTGHMLISGDVEPNESSSSKLGAWRVFFDTTKEAKAGASDKENAFNYAFKVHEDGTSANHWFLKNAYDSLRQKCLDDIAKGLNLNNKR